MARSKDLRERTRYTGATLATQVVTALAALLFLAPLLIILNYSFKTKRELYIGNPLALPLCSLTVRSTWYRETTRDARKSFPW